MSEWLYANRASDEGELSKALSWLVDEDSLAGAARRMGIEETIRLGKSYAGGAPSSSVLADSFEAVIGAVFLDSGIGPTSRIVVHFLLDDGRIGEPPSDYFSRSELEEHCQKLGSAAPAFSYAESGLDHEKSFECVVTIEGGLRGSGSGRTKKEAERKASADLLKRMSDNPRR